MDDFQDKVVVITGGATGIGYSFAKQFGSEGATVHIAGIRPERVEQAVEALTADGVRATGSICDVGQRDAVEELADEVWKTHGRADVILNNAGISVGRTSVIDAKREDIDNVLAVNLFGVWNGTSVFGKRFLKQGTPAAIYNVGSENSLFNAVPMNAPYIVSKHAVFALTEALREEVPEYIDVSLICPGFVRSEIGDPDVMLFGMDTNRFTAIIMKQLKAGRFFCVSHAYNAVRIEERNREISEAFEAYAPRYDGDEEFDVRTLIARMQGE